MVDSWRLRLAVHLGLAFLAMGLAGWFVLLLGRPEKDLLAARRNREGKLYGLTSGLMHFAFLQVVLGALVAGNDAGARLSDLAPDERQLLSGGRLLCAGPPGLGRVR